MGRKVRVEYPGALYHVLNPGDRREVIFRDTKDRERFLTTLGEACAKTGWQVHALCAMKFARSKVELAARLRAEATMTVRWIAHRLAMGTAGYMNDRLYRWGKGLLH